MKTIECNSGEQVKVDDDIYLKINRYKYYATLNKKSNRYRVNRIGSFKGKTMDIVMPREIMECPDDMVVDHINHDTLDNRRINLRICTNSQNCMNRKIHITNSSGFKGVSYDKFRNKWRARIMIDGKSISIGRFSNKKEAAMAYDKKAKELFGEYAYLNFKDVY